MSYINKTELIEKLQQLITQLYILEKDKSDFFILFIYFGNKIAELKLKLKRFILTSSTF